MKQNKLNIIIDTDIGFDLDDTWALLYAIKCDKFDVKLISISDGELDYKTKLTAKLLELCGRVDIPIAVGRATDGSVYPQKEFVKDYNLDNYKGKIYNNYKEAYEEVLSKDKCDIIALSPMTSLKDVIDLIRIKKCHIYAMMGSVYIGHRGKVGAIPEYNVEMDIKGAQIILNNCYKLTMFPLDCCGMFIMRSDNYMKVRNSESNMSKILMENYDLWLKYFPRANLEFDIDKSSNILFDLSTLAYLTHLDCFRSKKLKICVDDKGYTKVDKKGRRIKVVLETLNMDKIFSDVSDIYVNN